MRSSALSSNFDCFGKSSSRFWKNNVIIPTSILGTGLLGLNFVLLNPEEQT